MPTRALGVRACVLRRALDSVLSQHHVRALPIVVANGPDRDPALLRDLRKDRRLRLIERDQPSLPAAIRAGRRAVETEWFSTLDDDDVYLPGTLVARVRALQSRPAIDTVVSNGLVRCTGAERIHLDDVPGIEASPLRALHDGNWLLPGAWLCRTERVGCELFDAMPMALECTYLAIRFALHGPICFLAQPGVAWYADTPESESKSRYYLHRQLEALDRLLELPVPDETRQWIRSVKSASRHGIADMHFKERELIQAWRWHLRSLMGYGGWRYASFSLRLLLATGGR